MELTSLRSAGEQCLVAARMDGLVAALAQGDSEVQVLALGKDAAGVTLESTSLFNGASLTKLAAALAVLRLVDLGALGLDDALMDHLPSAAAAQPRVTLRRILSHSAGLPVDVRPNLAPYQRGLTWERLAAACLAMPPVAPVGTLVQYGNLGYGLVALIVERISGMPFARALGELVLTPLDIEGYLGDEPPRAPVMLSDVRGNNPPELQPFNSAFYRSLALPWAGLLTTATGAIKLVRAFTERPAGFLSPQLAAEARQNQTVGLPGGSAAPLWYSDCPWGLGPELRGAKQPHWAPPTVMPSSFGHAGASGCIVWHDPTIDLSYAVMGTRTAANGWLLRHAPTLGATLIAER